MRVCVCVCVCVLLCCFVLFFVVVCEVCFCGDVVFLPHLVYGWMGELNTELFIDLSVDQVIMLLVE